MTKSIYNKYNVLLFLLIILQIFGNIGGAYQPIRIFIVCLFPFLFGNIRLILSYKLEFCFFLFWILYSFLTLLWVIDFKEAINEISYLIINFSGFFIFVLLADKANEVKETIINAWVFLFLLTIPIALYELFFDVHLWTTVFESEKLIGGSTGGIKKFAAVTFGNYNGYVLLLIYISPFVASMCLYGVTKCKKMLGWVLLFVLFYILLMIASRSGILAMVIVLGILLYSFRTIALKKRLIVYTSVFVTIAILLYYFSESLLEQIAYRLIGSEPFQDSTREELIYAAFQMLLSSFLLGVGAGNYVVVSKSYIPMNSFPPHNLFMEILSQYGIYVFVFFAIFLFKIFLSKRNTSSSSFILTTALCLFPFVAIVDSGYLRSVLLWLWIASLFVLSKQNNNG